MASYLALEISFLCIQKKIFCTRNKQKLKRRKHKHNSGARCVLNMNILSTAITWEWYFPMINMKRNNFQTACKAEDLFLLKVELM